MEDSGASFGNYSTGQSLRPVLEIDNWLSDSHFCNTYNVSHTVSLRQHSTHSLKFSYVLL